MSLLTYCALRLLASAESAAHLDVATGLMALAERFGVVTDGARAEWRRLHEERNFAHALKMLVLSADEPVTLEEFDGELSKLGETNEGALFLDAARRLSTRRTLSAENAYLSGGLRKALLKAVAPLVTGSGRAVAALAGAMQVVYLNDLRVHGEVTIMADEHDLFCEVFAANRSLAATATDAHARVWAAGVFENLECWATTEVVAAETA